MKTCYRQALSLGRQINSSGKNLRKIHVGPGWKAASNTSTRINNNYLVRATARTDIIHHHKRWQSTSPLPACEIEDDSKGPVGDLFSFPQVDDSIVGLTGSIRRSFGPQSNAQAMITCGGEALAAHSSFDPNFSRAKDWIRSHPVGDSVLSPVLVSGLVGALVEAAFPKSVAVTSNMQFLRPLIVGVEVRAKIEVVGVTETASSSVVDMEELDRQQQQQKKRKTGYKVDLRTGVFRINDETIIAEGSHSVWIPDYLRM